MVGRAERLVYAVSQTARVSWYFGQYALAARMSGPRVPRERRPVGLRIPDTREVLAELRKLLIRDWRNIEAGYYRLPHDLIERPDRILADARRFFRDLPSVDRRRRERANAEVFHNPPPGANGLPRYYVQNFHYQTDGYLSEHSAKLYDHQVEVLFGGGADAMRRQALVPIHHHLRTRKVTESRLLDVATGTGRFLTFVKDNYPRLDVTALDLSHDYLSEARRRLRPWSRSRFVQAPAEAMPIGDAGIDIVTCIYLFHELPRKIRATVAREIFRVLKPGGILVFIDSLQTGDRPSFDGLLDLFPVAFHEPYYADYVKQDLEGLFRDVGFVPTSGTLAFMSKVLVLRKPELGEG